MQLATQADSMAWGAMQSATQGTARKGQGYLPDDEPQTGRQYQA